MPAARLPFVFMNMAVSADGKIAPASRQFVPFGTRLDHQRLLELRARADAVLCGARTADLAKIDLGPGGPRYQKMRRANGLAEFNLRVIVSGSVSIDPRAHLFTRRFSPILLLTTQSAPAARLKKVAPLFAGIFQSPGSALDFRQAFAWLRAEWKVLRLLCEGGGEVNAELFRQGLVNELYLTLCPIILGGRTAPTLADGEGAARLSNATRLKPRTLEPIEGEMYCRYSVIQ